MTPEYLASLSRLELEDEVTHYSKCYDMAAQQSDEHRTEVKNLKKQLDVWVKAHTDLKKAHKSLLDTHATLKAQQIDSLQHVESFTELERRVEYQAKRIHDEMQSNKKLRETIDGLNMVNAQLSTALEQQKYAHSKKLAHMIEVPDHHRAVYIAMKNAIEENHFGATVSVRENVYGIAPVYKFYFSHTPGSGLSAGGGISNSFDIYTNGKESVSVPSVAEQKAQADRQLDDLRNQFCREMDIVNREVSRARDALNLKATQITPSVEVLDPHLPPHALKPELDPDLQSAAQQFKAQQFIPKHFKKFW